MKVICLRPREKGADSGFMFKSNFDLSRASRI